MFADEIREQLLHTNMQRFRGGLVFKARRLYVSPNCKLESNKEEKKKAHRLCVSLNSRLESNKEEKPPWRQPRGKWMVSLVNSHTNATSKRLHLWEIDLRFAVKSTPGWKKRACGARTRRWHWPGSSLDPVYVYVVLYAYM